MRTKTSKWITVKDGIITEIHSSDTIQPNMTKTPWNGEVKLNTPVLWYDENYKRIPDKILIEKRIRNDNRGTYYSKSNYKQTVTIKDLDVPVPEGVTNIPPIANEPCIWNGKKWIIDEDAKAEMERINSLLSDMEVKEFVSELAGVPDENLQIREKGEELRRMLETSVKEVKQIEKGAVLT